jgi:hypothetical protein
MSQGAGLLLLPRQRCLLAVALYMISVWSALLLLLLQGEGCGPQLPLHARPCHQTTARAACLVALETVCTCLLCTFRALTAAAAAAAAAAGRRLLAATAASCRAQPPTLSTCSLSCCARDSLAPAYYARSAPSLPLLLLLLQGGGCWPQLPLPAGPSHQP